MKMQVWVNPVSITENRRDSEKRSRDEAGMDDLASSHSEPVVCSLCPTQTEPTAVPLTLLKVGLTA